MQFPVFAASKRELFAQRLKISVAVVVIMFLVDIDFIIIYEIQTDGGKRSYWQW